MYSRALEKPELIIINLILHYVSLPGFGWDALLKMTKIKLDVISDYDMYLMIESMSMISHRHSKANNI